MIWTRFEVMAATALPLGIALSLAGSPAVSNPVADGLVPNAPEPVSFADEVKPIFDAKCVTCHGGTDDRGQVVKEMGLDLTSYETLMQGSEYGSVIEAGNADDSVLWQMVEFGDMPQEGDPLTEEELATIKTWITEGAENN